MGNSGSVNKDGEADVSISITDSSGNTLKLLTFKEKKNASTSNFYYFDIDQDTAKTLIRTGSFNILVHMGFDTNNNEIINPNLIPGDYKNTNKYEYLSYNSNRIGNNRYIDIAHNEAGIILRHSSGKKSRLFEIVLHKVRS